jgi:glycosyltransferase involved in cell wall biosynthesis
VDDHPLVTVVVPTRDRPRLLARALAAILAQDYAGSIECVVVFDQSQPELPLDLAVPPRRTVRAIRNTRRPGLPGARNSGILEATGELVAFCDDDDEWLPAKLTEQVRHLMASTRHAVATTGIVTVMQGRSRERVLDLPEVPHEMFLASRVMEVHSSTLLIRRPALLDEIGLIDEDIPGGYAEDHEWLLRASRLAPILVTPAPLVRVLIHRNSYFSEQWQLIADASRYMLDRHPDLRTSRQGLARIYGRLALAEGALRHGRAARQYAVASLRLQWRQHRAYTAILMSLRLLTPEGAIRLANALKSALSWWSESMAPRLRRSGHDPAPGSAAEGLLQGGQHERDLVGGGVGPHEADPPD